MKNSLIMFFALACFVAKAQVTTIAPGQSAPDFKLNNVDNKEISFNSYPKAKGFIIVFTCNTCPYAKLYEQRIIDINDKYAALGYPVIAINPNDPELSKGDSFDKMKELAKSKNYQFPYLFDDGQVVTNLYGARNTPHLFVISKTANDNKIIYTGAIDNDPENTNPDKKKYVEDAISAVLKDDQPAVNATKAIGCSVRRKGTK